MFDLLPFLRFAIKSHPNVSLHYLYCAKAIRDNVLIMKVAVFRVVAPCSLVDVYRRLRGACYLHHQTFTRLHVATAQKTVIFILAVLRTSNLTMY
jgi:hypothetical protein